MRFGYNALIVGFLSYLFLLALVLISPSPVKEEPKLLFDRNGCKTYVFHHKGSRNYYTDCEKQDEKSEPSSTGTQDS